MANQKIEFSDLELERFLRDLNMAKNYIKNAEYLIREKGLERALDAYDEQE